MKFNYTEKQYVQLAKEKLCQILKEIPLQIMKLAEMYR